MGMLNDIRFGGERTTRRVLVACTSALLTAALPLAHAQTSAPTSSSASQGAQAPAATSPAPAQSQTQAAPTSAQSTSPQPPANNVAPSGTTAPAPASADEPTAPTIKVGVNEVDLVFTVTDKKGHFVTGLHQSDFGLLDNRMAPEKVSEFKQQTNLPLRVGIMLDTSSSIRGRFEFEQDSAIAFLLQVLHRNDRAFVEGFDVQMDVAQGFTNNIDLLNQGIRKLRPGGGTALYDALYTTCRDQMLTIRETGAVRKAIILVSDGDDNYSHALESDAIKECQRADTTVYAISTNISPSKDKGDDVLQAIADATGGRAFYPTRIEDVASGFNSIEEELRSQYLLVYTPANFRPDGSFRTIYLHANDPKLHVRAHTGYFAPKASY